MSKTKEGKATSSRINYFFNEVFFEAIGGKDWTGLHQFA